MKRKVALRKLKRKCLVCNNSFKKGDVYYVKRHVFSDGGIFAVEETCCPRCKYRRERQEERFERFKLNCPHHLKQEVWSYIPGEAVMQPDHTECLICGEWV